MSNPESVRHNSDDTVELRLQLHHVTSQRDAFQAALTKEVLAVVSGAARLRLVALETPEGQPVLVNPANVLTLSNSPNSSGQAVVQIALPTQTVRVKGTVAQVSDALSR